MPQVIPVTDYILSEEPAWALAEVNLQVPFKGLRRYQIVYVARDDKLTEYRKDLGPAKDFETIQFRIPSVWVHSVGELREIASDLHKNPKRPFEVGPEPYGQKLIEAYHDLEEAEKNARKGRKLYS